MVTWKAFVIVSVALAGGIASVAAYILTRVESKMKQTQQDIERSQDQLNRHINYIRDRVDKNESHFISRDEVLQNLDDIRSRLEQLTQNIVNGKHK